MAPAARSAGPTGLHRAIEEGELVVRQRSWPNTVGGGVIRALVVGALLVPVAAEIVDVDVELLLGLLVLLAVAGGVFVVGRGLGERNRQLLRITPDALVFPGGARVSYDDVVDVFPIHYKQDFAATLLMVLAVTADDVGDGPFAAVPEPLDYYDEHGQPTGHTRDGSVVGLPPPNPPAEALASDARVLRVDPGARAGVAGAFTAQGVATPLRCRISLCWGATRRGIGGSAPRRARRGQRPQAREA